MVSSRFHSSVRDGTAYECDLTDAFFIPDGRRPVQILNQPRRHQRRRRRKKITTKIVGTRRSLLIFLKVILRDEDHFKQWLSARCHFRFERSNSNYTYTLGESLLRPAHPVQTSCHSLNPAIAEDLPPFCHKLLYFSSIFAKNIFDNF